HRMAVEITRAGEMAATLTRQLLLMCRKQPVHTEVHDLNAVLTDVERILRRGVHPGISPAPNPSSEPHRGKGDPPQNQQEEVDADGQRSRQYAQGRKDYHPDAGH